MLPPGEKDKNMKIALRRTVAVLAGMTLGLGFSLAASAEDAVLSVVSVRVNPGQMEKYMARVKKLQGAMERLGAGGHVEAWQVSVAGPATGTTLVGIEYPSLTAYAEGTAKTEGDAEFGKLIAGLDGLRTIQSASLYRQISGPGSAGDIPTGSVLQTVSVRVKPGRLDAYLGRVEKLRKISERLGSSSAMRVWQATAAGEATGTLVIGVIYEDLATYAAESMKFQNDSEWRKLVDGLVDIRTILGVGLSQNLGP